MEETTSTTSTERSEEKCHWSEVGNNSDWLWVGCIGKKANLWKACRKRGITPVQAFISCPWCGKKVELAKIEKKIRH